jgi:regulator of RNase E activity RraA
LIVADRDGVTTIPAHFDPRVILRKAEEIRERELRFQNAVLKPGVTVEQAWAYQREILGTDK